MTLIVVKIFIRFTVNFTNIALMLLELKAEPISRAKESSSSRVQSGCNEEVQVYHPSLQHL